MSRGYIFKEKFNKDPKKLSLEEIEDIAIGKNRNKSTGYRPENKIVITRGNVFKIKLHETESLLRKFLKDS